MMPLKHILKNKLLFQKHFNLQEWSIDNWPFWMFEENIKLINEIIEEEDNKSRKQEEAQQKQMGGFDPGSAMKNATSGLGNFQMPKF
jgi:hypothetical protein